MGVSDQLIVKVSADNELQQYLSELKLSIVKEISKNLYLLKVTDKSLTIVAANKLKTE